jgi:hypothetical protein
VAGGWLSLDQFASITARVESGVARSRALDEAGVSDADWLAAQEQWLSTIASLATNGKMTLHRRFTALLEEHHRAIAVANEQRSRQLDGEHPVTPQRTMSRLAGRALERRSSAVQRVGGWPFPPAQAAAVPAARQLAVGGGSWHAGSDATPRQRPPTGDMPAYGSSVTLPFAPAEAADGARASKRRQQQEAGEQPRTVMPFAQRVAERKADVDIRMAPDDPLMRTVDATSSPLAHAMPFDVKIERPTADPMMRTMAMKAVPDSASLPFARKPGAAGHSASEPKAAPGASDGALPFRRAQQAADDATSEATSAQVSVTIEAYAWLCAQLDAAPEQSAEILSAAGMTPASKQALDDHFSARMRRESKLRAHYIEARMKFAAQGKR